MNVSARHQDLLKKTFLDYQSTEEFMANPLIVSRAEGLYYWDVEGRRYFDGISGIYSTFLGHRHPRIEEAIRADLPEMKRIFIEPDSDYDAAQDPLVDPVARAATT